MSEAAAPGGADGAGAVQAALKAAGFEGVALEVYASGGRLGEKLGIEFVELSAQRLVATMPVEGNTQPAGLLHGGASAALAETLGSIGAAMHAGPGAMVVGVDLNATHHRGARSGLVTGTATPLFLGRTVATYEVVITDENDKRVCTARLSCLIRQP